MEGEGENRKRIVVQLVADCQVSVFKYIYMWALLACWLACLLPFSHSIALLALQMQALMRELKWDASGSPLDQQVGG